MELEEADLVQRPGMTHRTTYKGRAYLIEHRGNATSRTIVVHDATRPGTECKRAIPRAVDTPTELRRIESELLEIMDRAARREQQETAAADLGVEDAVGRAREVRTRMRAGQLDYSAAHRELAPLLARIDRAAAEVAARHKRKHRPFTVAGFLRGNA